MNPYNDGLMGGDDPNVYRGYRGPMAGVRVLPEKLPAELKVELLRWEHELSQPDSTYYDFFLDRVIR